jgi:hypothetical protein
MSGAGDAPPWAAGHAVLPKAVPTGQHSKHF